MRIHPRLLLRLRRRLIHTTTHTRTHNNRHRHIHTRKRSRGRGKGKSCAQDVGNKPQMDDCADKGCCAPTATTARCSGDSKDAKGLRYGSEQTTDLEAGFSGKEHVILSISGMTCTGCET